MVVRMIWCALMACVIAGGLHATEEVIVVEQQYKILKIGEGGVDAKDIKQKLYIHKDWVRIDDFSDATAAQPTETFFIDFKEKKIYDADNLGPKMTVVTFADRREKIEQNIKDVQRDLKNMDEGAQKKKFQRLNKALLDLDRNFETKELPDKSKVSGVDCKVIEIVDSGENEYVPYKASLHPDIILPSDYADALFLLKILGKGMKEYLSKQKDLFQHLPMELTLDLAAGGKLETKVVKVERKRLDQLDAGLDQPPAIKMPPTPDPKKGK